MPFFNPGVLGSNIPQPLELLFYLNSGVLHNSHAKIISYIYGIGCWLKLGASCHMVRHIYFGAFFCFTYPSSEGDTIGHMYWPFYFV